MFIFLKTKVTSTNEEYCNDAHAHYDFLLAVILLPRKPPENPKRENKLEYLDDRMPLEDIKMAKDAMSEAQFGQLVDRINQVRDLEIFARFYGPLNVKWPIKC